MENSEYELGLYVSRRTNMTKRKRPENKNSKECLRPPCCLERERSLMCEKTVVVLVYGFNRQEW